MLDAEFENTNLVPQYSPAALAIFFKVKNCATHCIMSKSHILSEMLMYSVSIRLCRNYTNF